MVWSGVDEVGVGDGVVRGGYSRGRCGERQMKKEEGLM